MRSRRPASCNSRRRWPSSSLYRGVRVNAIAPGFIVTEINDEYLKSHPDMTRHIPAGRFGETRDLEGPLLLLCSDAGAFMAGSTVVVDGGQVLTIAGA